MENNPLVSIAMPVYNPDSTLRAAVLSIIKQDLKSWELFIVDDGSKNDIYELIGDLHDLRITILRDGVNLGLAQRLNECIDRSRGKFFARMDQDDISYPSRLSRQVDFLKKNSDIDLLSTKALVINENYDVIGVLPYALDHVSLLAKPWCTIYMPHPTWVGHIDWFKRNKYQIPSSYLSEDQELLLRASRYSRYATMNEILFAYRIRNQMHRHKLLKNRLAVIKFQHKFFLSNREYGNIFMIYLVYFLKNFFDLFSSHSGGLGFLRYTKITEIEFLEWIRCRDQISR